jgi:hypothetical protein
MKKTTQFRELFRLFRQRFVDSDALAPDADFNTNLWQILGLLAVPGLWASTMLYGALLDPDTAYSVWMLRGARTFFCAYSFTVTGFATLFEWDMLFPERRDFLVLTLFPIRMRDLFLAKLASLGVLLGVLIGTVNAGALSILVLALTFESRAHSVKFLGKIVGFLTGTTASAIFGFLIVAGLQGLLINVLPVRLFRKVSPYVQMVGMSAMVLALVLFPVYINVLVVLAHQEWLWWFPPYWFAAGQELWGGAPGALLHAVGWWGWKMFAGALVLFVVTWATGFARHYRRTLESEDTTAGSVRGGKSWFDRLLHTPQERAVFYFSGSILTRSTKHRLFLACYWSAGVAFGLISALSLDGGQIAFKADGLRAFPFLMTFFAISGLRAVFQFPAELASNWAFQIAEAGWGSATRYATRVRVLLSGLAPLVLFFVPVEIANWGVRLGAMHVALQVAAGVLLTEAFFWTFNKVPFTCSYFPGKMNLGLLVAFYLYGFTNYAFTMADLERWMDTHLWVGLLILVAVVALLRIARRHRTGDWAVRFDGSEPEILALDLS